MEALQIKVDNLEWELNSIRGENRRLREDNPERTAPLDELQRATSDMAVLTK